jgi:hypothetical protein
MEVNGLAAGSERAHLSVAGPFNAGPSSFENDKGFSGF